MERIRKSGGKDATFRTNSRIAPVAYLCALAYDPMTTSSCPAKEQLHKTAHELVAVLQQAVRPAEIASSTETVRSLGTQLVNLYERIIEGNAYLAHGADQEAHEKEWSSLTWPLLCILPRLAMRPDDQRNLIQKLNCSLVLLVNAVTQYDVPPMGMSMSILSMGMNPNDCGYVHFIRSHNETTQMLQNLYEMGDGDRLANFGHNQLPKYINDFRDFCLYYGNSVLSRLRMAQVERMAKNRQMDDSPVKLAVAYYCHMMYVLGSLAARLFVIHLDWSNYRFPGTDTARALFDIVIATAEQLLCDCLMGCKPSVTAILVTNNLFPFNCSSLAPPILFQSFDVQIVSEETAQAIQTEIREIKQGQRQASSIGVFPSAALLAQKPTSGVKRNNATASSEGCNTAHKKSDVNSRESVTIPASWHDKHASWQAAYPHLLCTTRQKDTVLLDSRSGQMGKRPLFYFYIRGAVYSPSGHISYVRTLSLPFTIATRRNQDCQVQRMMSSYTATCFWLYGLQSLDGLILNWCDTGIPWETFVELYRSYFTVNAEVTRALSDDDFRLMEDKLTCDDCREYKDENRRLVTFKNVLCPHLRYDVEQNPMRFSIWRGLLEVLQIYQDSKTNVKTLWNDNILMGFSDIDEVNALLENHQSVMCLRVSHVIGGSICIAMKPGNRQIVHLEPIELKKLQAKSAFEYLSDIADSAKIDYVLTANRELVLVSDLVRKYNIGADHGKVRTITTNISHGGTTDKMTKMRFTPIRIAVVTCSTEPPPTTPPMLPPANYPRYQNGSAVPARRATVEPPIPFETQLNALMKAHGKTAMDVVGSLGFGEPPQPTMAWSSLDNQLFMNSEFGYGVAATRTSPFQSALGAPDLLLDGSGQCSVRVNAPPYLPVRVSAQAKHGHFPLP